MHNPEAIQCYSHVILDEIHEQSVEADFLLLIVCQVIRSGWEGRLVLMSATIAADSFTDYLLGSPPPYHVGAKRFPVQRVFIDQIHSVKPASPLLKKSSLQQHLRNAQSTFPLSLGSKPTVKNVVLNIAAEAIFQHAKPETSVLVFLPGMAEINSLHLIMEEILEQIDLTVSVRLFVLHSQIPFEEQADAFKPPHTNTINVILATNTAESSVTIPRLYLVIDTAIRQ